MLDLPLHCYRMALAHDKTYLTEAHIHGIIQFLMKIDMAFTSPQKKLLTIGAAQNGQTVHVPSHQRATYNGCVLREFLLVERNLTSLWRVLRGWGWDVRAPALKLTRSDILRLWVRNRLRTLGRPNPDISQLKANFIFNYRTKLFNSTGGERRWRKNDEGKVVFFNADKRLGRPDDIILGESIHRQLDIKEHLIDFMLFGFCNRKGKRSPVLTEDQWTRIATRPWEIAKMLLPTSGQTISKKKEQSKAGDEEKYKDMSRVTNVSESEAENGVEARGMDGVETQAEDGAEDGAEDPENGEEDETDWAGDIANTFGQEDSDEEDEEDTEA